jgi:hypothetical protein
VEVNVGFRVNDVGEIIEGIVGQYKYMCFPTEATFAEKLREERVNEPGVPVIFRENPPPVDADPLHEHDVKLHVVMFNFFDAPR